MNGEAIYYPDVFSYVPGLILWKKVVRNPFTLIKLLKLVPLLLAMYYNTALQKTIYISDEPSKN